LLPNSSTIQASQAGKLPFHPSLSDKATTAHVLNGITNSSLINLGQLCDDDCIAIFTKQKMHVCKNKMCVLSGTRNHTDGLWDIPLATTSLSSLSLAPTPVFAANAIIRKDMTKTALAQYLYGCCSSPVLSTWQQAIRNGNFVTWPGIDSLSIDKHLPKSIASAKGHLDQERKNLQSTKPLKQNDDDSFSHRLIPPTKKPTLCVPPSNPSWPNTKHTMTSQVGSRIDLLVVTSIY
jgi:hypothetical protein